MRQIPKDKRTEPARSSREPLGEGPQNDAPVSKRTMFLSSMSDEDIISVARKVMKEKRLHTRAELRKYNPIVYEAVKRRGLVSEVGFEDKAKENKPVKEEGA